MTEDDKSIKEAWEIIIETRLDSVPSEEELRSSLFFSEKFPEKKTKKLPKKFFYISGKIISKLVLYIIIILLLAGSITAYAVVQFLQREIHEKNTDISLDKKQIQNIEMQDRYFPSYLPENYYEVERQLTDNSTIVHYANGTYNIYFRQELPTSEGSIDNENTNESLFTIEEAEVIYTEKHGEKTLIFSVFGYLFYIDTNAENMTKEQLMQMAGSIRKEN